MNPGRFFIPNINASPFMRMPPNIPINPMIRNNLLAGRSTTGLINRIFSGIKTINWRGLISGANKTLNVVNQTIPLIRQAKPMVNNVKSMVQLAKAFGKETNTKVTSIPKNNIINKNIKIKNTNNKTNDYPTFFV